MYSLFRSTWKDSRIFDFHINTARVRTPSVRPLPKRTTCTLLAFCELMYKCSALTSWSQSLLLVGMLFTAPRIRLTAASACNMKDLWILRHGQAAHNPRAEEARAGGCSFEEFFELMRQDDSLDSPLTEHGRQQARSISDRLAPMRKHIELVVSSPLSRALETANLALPPTPSSSCDHHNNSSNGPDDTTEPIINRICYEGFREINGVLRNAQRRSLSQLRENFPDWNFDNLSSEEDDTWDVETLECTEAAAMRGLQGLQWVYRERPETSILLVAHGGILRYLMEHATCLLHDGRTHPDNIIDDDVRLRPVSARFDNCELRRYRLECQDDGNIISLTEIDFVA